MDEKRSAKAAKNGPGRETGEAAAVRVNSKATEDEDEVVFVEEVHVQQRKMP